MVFSSVVFLFRLLPIFMILYFATYICPAARRMRNVILFLGSLLFYAWGEPVYVVLLLFSTLSDYIHGLLIDKYRGRKIATVFLVTSILINLGVLGYFKYADFLIGAVNKLSGMSFLGLQIPAFSIPLTNLPLPIGISFYTFQTMSYTIDVYKGEAKMQKNILDFGVFVTMFPQLIAGPIVRYVDVQDDLRDHHGTLEDINYGCRRFVAGLAKKVLLANNMGLLWEEVLATGADNANVMMAWIGILAYAFQIYFDFSGYSDMAIGLGSIMGFRFPENFQYPYISATITEFWRRWHMSLGQWFRDYVYIPLGGNRKGMGRQLFNILVVWALTGIWHGAGWNFLLWGLWFALFLILEKIGLKKVFDFVPRIFGWIYTMIVVMFGWVLFAIEDVFVMWEYVKAMTGFNGRGLFNSSALFVLREYAVLMGIAVLAALPLGHRVSERLRHAQSGPAIAIRRLLDKVILALLLLASIAYIVDASYNPFLYFRF